MMDSQSKFISIAFIAVLTLLLSVGSYSCKKIVNPNAGKNTKDTIQYTFLKTRVFAQFVDAATNENITSYDGSILSVEIVGKSNMMVADILGVNKEKYYPQNGLLSFSLLPDMAPSPSSPVVFTIKTKLLGYLPAFKEVTITSEGDYYIKIPLVYLEMPPEGIIIETLNNVGNLYKGVVNSDIVITTTSGEAKITIPAGAKLSASDSTFLSGNLFLKLIYHNLDSDIGMATISGGVNSSIIKDNNIANALFFPGAVLDLIITDSDYKDAAYLEDKKLEIEVVIPNGTYNPSVWSNYKNGDNIDVAVYLPDTGLWSYEESAIITTGNGGLIASTSTFGLHSYIFGNYKSIVCNDGPSFKLAGGCQQCGSILLDGILRKEIDDSFISRITVAANWEGTSSISERTGNTKAYIDWGENNNCNSCSIDPSVSPTSIDNMCTQATISLPLIDNGTSVISINANFNGQCLSDTNFIILPSFGIWTRHIDSPCWRWSSMENGVANICNLNFGETYIIGTHFDDMWQQWEITIDNESDYNFTLEFSDHVCNDIFGIL